MVLEGRIRAWFLLRNNATLISYEYFSFLWDDTYLRICYFIIYFLLEVYNIYSLDIILKVLEVRMMKCSFPLISP